MNHPLIVTTNYLASDSELIVVGGDVNISVLAAISYGGYLWNDAIRTNITALPQSDIVGRGVAWNGSNWCVVGSSRLILDDSAFYSELTFISDNGYTWIVTTQNENFILGQAKGIASDGEYWVKVGSRRTTNTTCCISSNGRNWLTASQDPFSRGEANGIAWNGYYWCTVGYSSDYSVTVATSIDGSNWNRSTLQDPFFELNNTENKGYGIAWNGSYWLAVGRVNGGRIAKSINGREWNIINISFFDTITGIAWSGTNWGIVGFNSDNTITFAISSGDTTTFTASGSNPFPGGRANGIAWTGSLWALSGRNSNSSVNVAISSNGLDWTRTSAFSNGFGLHIASKFTKYLIPTIESQIPTFVTVGSNSSGTQAISRSLNGIKWYSASNNPFPGGVGYHVAYNSSNVWLAVGKNADGSVTAATSSNGSFWIPSIDNPFPGGVGNGIAWNGSNAWIAVGANSNSTICTSISFNGSNWNTGGNPFPGGSGYGIAWNSAYWCAVGNTSAGIISARSTSGVVWDTTIISSTGKLYGIAWNSLYWCAVGNGAWISEDTYTWTLAINPFGTGTIYGIAWNGSYWCAVGSNVGGSITAAISTDPRISWTASTTNPFGILGTGYGISWNGHFWCAVGTNSGSITFSKSIDGLIWKDATDNFTGGSSYGIASRFTDYLLPVAIPPDPPTINSIDPLVGALTVNFSGSLKNGGVEIEGYYYSINNINYTRVNDNEFSFTINNLINGVPYTVYMKARNAADYYSSVTSSVGNPDIAPPPPTINNIIARDHSLFVSYNSPINNAGSAITDYKYSTNGVDYISMGTQPINGIIQINGLDNGRDYQISLKSRNSKDSIATPSILASPIGPVKNLRAAYTVPEFPSNTEGWTTATIVISWNPPDNEGPNMVSYHIRGGNEHTIPNLEEYVQVNSTSYTVSIPNTYLDFFFFQVTTTNYLNPLNDPNRESSFTSQMGVYGTNYLARRTDPRNGGAFVNYFGTTRFGYLWYGDTVDIPSLTTLSLSYYRIYIPYVSFSTLTQTIDIYADGERIGDGTGYGSMYKYSKKLYPKNNTTIGNPDPENMGSPILLGPVQFNYILFGYDSSDNIIFLTNLIVGVYVGRSFF
jgi:hypothetical protein